ncbi:iron complex outermembrane receptor protein [Rhizobium sp. PP-WC-1G-195]|nr:iron complex outermembrane receptor protein [Rhizobium sp. PP-WC-1G-195]
MLRLFKRRYFSSSAVLLVMAGSALGSAASAQDSEPATVLEQITVRGEKGDGPVDGYAAKQSKAGTKTDTPLIKTPQSVAVVSKQQMQDMDVQSVAESLRYTPGVITEYRGASNLNDEMFVRGFYYVPRYLDGLFFGSGLSYSKLNPDLLERVELLSGPSSVLYGQANPGGLVNMVSKKPTDTPLHEVELTAGSRDHVGASFDVSDKVPASDSLSYRLVGTGLTTQLQEDFTKQRAFAIAPSVTWAPSDQTTLTILGGYQNEPHAGFRNFLDAAGTVTPIAGYGYVSRDFFVSDPDYERFTREQAWIGYEFEHEINDTFTVRQNARYQSTQYEQNTLVWGYTSPDPVTGFNTIVNRVASGGTDKVDQFVIDNQLQADFDTGAAQHTLLAGLDYRDVSREYRWGRNWAVPTIDLTNPRYGGIDYDALVLNPSSREDTKAKQAGLYLQDQIEIGNFNLSAGGRYDWAKTDIDDLLGSNDQAYTDNAFTWRAGTIYNFDNGIAPYVSYSTSFEPSLTAPGVGQDAFKPTTAEQVEVGVKYAPENRNIVLTAAYYDLTQNDVVLGKWDSSLGQSVYSQIGKIHNRGLELSARGEVNENLSLIASYAYLDSEIVDSVETDTLGKMPARVPRHQAALWATHAFASGPLNGFTAGAGVRYIGKSWGDDQNRFSVDAAALVDASLSYDFAALNPDWNGTSLKINVKNLANKTFVASCANSTACFYGEGRTVTATLKRTW